MSIRRATLSDLPEILDRTAEFNSVFYPVRLDPVKTLVACTDMIRNHSVFVSDRGYIAGTVLEDPFRDRKILVELGWYATDGNGIRLLRRFIQEAKDLKVDTVCMSTLQTSNNSASKLLTRMGFIASETSYTLDLG